MLNVDFRRLFLLFVFIVGGFISGIAQSYSNLNWYFGSNQRNFRFIRPSYTTENVTLPNNLGLGGSAVATDPVTGALLFYTDGVTVYDAFNNALSATLIGNPNFNQGVAICANPANTNQYFIFTNNGANIRRSVYDKNEYSSFTPGFPAPGQGNLIAPINDTNNLPVGTLSEGMIVISNASLNGFWLISFDEAAANYNVTEIDSLGAISTVSAPIAGAPTAVANFSYNALTDQIAVSPSLPTEEVAILTIDRATGILSFNSNVPGTNVSALTSNIYDTEWSNNGDILYLSGNFGEADSLMQINFSEATPRLRVVSGQQLTRSFGLQMGPDSTIYHLYETPAGLLRVGRINSPDSIVSQTLYAPRPLGNQNFEGQQFPAFLPPFDPMLTVDFTFAGTCANVPTLFFPDITPQADSVIWDFGDGNFSRQLNGFNTYTTAGQYNVTLGAFLNGTLAFTTKPVDIVDFDLTIAGFPQSDTICAEDFPKSYTATASGANAGSVTFRWSNQDDTNAGATTSISEPGSYYVIATDPGGCEAYGPLQVVEYRAIEQRAFIWYFGDNAGIDFNPMADTPPGAPVPIPFGDLSIYNRGNQMQSPEGCAIYCDDNGNPIFYTDGESVYDREGNEFAINIGGENGSTQSSFIVPAPSDATLYYIFLSKQVYSVSGAFEYEFSFVIYDLKKRQGLGDLVRDGLGNVASTVLYNGNTERITGNNNWVIAHEFGNNNFRAYPLTALGVGNPVVSNVGKSHPSTMESAGRGYMKLSNSSKLAVALSLSNTENFVELFQFVDSSGAVTAPVTLDFGTETGEVYGIEFSPDENKLFATLRKAGGGTKIFRWEIDTTTVVGAVTDPDYIRASREEIANEASIDMGAMQQGPDGQIYIAKSGAPNLATITNPNGIPNSLPTGNDAGFTVSGFALSSGTTSTLGLPNFINQFNSAPPNLLISVLNGCSGEINDFSVLSPSSLERYRWRINDSTGTEVLRSAVTDNGQYSFIISTPGLYTAIVDIIPDCSTFDVPVSSVQQNFTINSLPDFTIDTILDPSGCGINDGSFNLNINGTDPYVYAVSGPVAVSPDTVQAPIVINIPNLSAGGYTITVTNAVTGCLETGVAVLNDPAPYGVTATPIITDCDGNNGGIAINVTGTPLLDMRYVLRLQANSSIVAVGTDPGISFTIPASIGTYILEISDANNCTITISDLNVIPPPLVNLTLPNELIICDDQPAQIIYSSTNAISVSVSGPSQPTFSADNRNDPDTVTVTLPGIYTFTAFGDQDNTCDNFGALEVIFNSPSPSPFATRFVICPDDPVEANKKVTLPSPPSGFESIRWFRSNGNEITGNSTDYQFNTAGDSLIILNNGVITAEITNFLGCVTIADINIIEDCKARINAPNAFSPNGDGKNDSFFVFPVLVADEDFEIFIFNRWGEMIFQSDQLDFVWNGSYNNDESKPLPGGTYAYRINFRSAAKPDEGIKERRGGVTLIR
jgi:gliding motility-associated-like protein